MTGEIDAMAEILCREVLDCMGDYDVNTDVVRNDPEFGPSMRALAEYLAKKFGPERTLRDWFAGQALANPRTHRDDREPDFGTPDQIAEQAYAVADAMLKARQS